MSQTNEDDFLKRNSIFDWSFQPRISINPFNANQQSFDWINIETNAGGSFQPRASINPFALKQQPSSHPGYKRVSKHRHSYCTGSTYTGTHDSIGFSGFGIYVYPHGVKYEGDFQNGEFHGEGVLKYPNGDKVRGTWVKGKLRKHIFQFSDGLEIDKHPWEYLKFPFRNFASEKNENGMLDELHMKKETPCETPTNFYFTGDGYFDPTSKIIYDFNKKIIRIASTEEEIEIRKKFHADILDDSAVGYLSHLFEFWITGRKREIEELGESVKTVDEDDRLSIMANANRSVSTYSLIFHNQY